MTVIAEWPDVALPPLGVDRYTAFVALTHDPKIDDPALTHALERDCFYIGALGSRKTHAPPRRAAARRRALSDAELARIHAPIGLDIGAVSPAEIAVAIMGEITRAAAPDAGGRSGMKFGAGPAARGATARIAVHSHPPGRPGAQEGHADRPGRGRGAEGRRHRGDRGGAARAGRRVRGRGRGRDRRGGGRARACTSTAPSPAAPICSPKHAGVLVVDKDAHRRAQPRRRGDHVRDAAGLQAGGRRRDDRDGEDHSVRGRRRARDAALAAARGEAARPRRALQGHARSASSRRCCRASPTR